MIIDTIEMKRITLILAAIVAIGLAACAQKTVNQKEETKKMKTLVAYFSATGTTERVATQFHGRYLT